MKLVIVFGPQAVGKMTVGQHLAEQTGLKLFHNHMSIDFVSQFFDYGTPSGKRLVSLIRQEIFEEVSRSDLKGLIFTFVWGFDLQSDWDYIEAVSKLFESRGGTVCLVELEADIEERKKRNVTENRLLHKPSKRDVKWSEGELVATYEKHRLNSRPGEIQKPNYIRINNENMEPEQVADLIRERFGL
ncbi:P-loop NTPase family protein [Saccharibacillus alkalitolerans]|uniref:AAA family ATPase n=1 Tax=Saccharibacillus alkalitolerans TaxID=2705290 RepID=A0ABX0FE48_9BACL|nr:AAA family ATPase [Saccharibacillus alkalitolerans]NGZ76932.1 AAA family ATPase [Saccharibacillus alkalitolerans]